MSNNTLAMKVIVNTLTGKVLYGSNVDVKLKESETIIEVDNPELIKNHYNFNTKEFYDVPEEEIQ